MESIGPIMQPLCLAVLTSSCGEWHFYDHAALQTALSSLPMANEKDADPGVQTSGVTVGVHHGQHGRRGNKVRQHSKSDVCEGFTASECMTWGRHKAHIASNTCKVKGSLKSSNDKLRLKVNELVGLLSKKICSKLSTQPTDVDPWTVTDPWSGASLLHSNCAKDYHDAWAAWSKCQARNGRRAGLTLASINRSGCVDSVDLNDGEIERGPDAPADVGVEDPLISAAPNDQKYDDTGSNGQDVVGSVGASEEAHGGMGLNSQQHLFPAHPSKPDEQREGEDSHIEKVIKTHEDRRSMNVSRNTQGSRGHEWMSQKVVGRVRAV